MRVISGRKTTVEVVPLEEALLFVETYHRQGLAVPGKNVHAFGLHFHDELVAVAIFCNPRTAGMQKKYTTELFRMVFKTDVRIQGGASKLIKAFLANKPWDLFTYQDTSGESTDVYLHSGMKLVKAAVPKQILVRDGLTRATTENNRKDWFSFEQVIQNGPDRLLGTNLGEVLRDNGTRKSNIDLFIEDCGYHLEEVPGDRVYEWLNPNISFYIYKITNKRDGKYYIGRHMIKMSNPLDNDCFKDGYMGSGGIEYRKWRKENLQDLNKTILSIHYTWRAVVKAEVKAIGRKNLDDPLCLNLLPGGIGNARLTYKDIERNCEIHGVTLHRGKSCLRCSANSGYESFECAIHGSVFYRGGACLQCAAAKRLTTDECSIHGLVNFQDNKCTICTSIKQFTEKECSIHGLTIHKGLSCALCSAQKPITLKLCVVHGETKHQGTICVQCANELKVSIKECSIHGMVKHRGETCSTCTANSHQNYRECSIHGFVRHQKNSCTFCVSQKAFLLKECSIHGETTFQGDNCMKCFTLKNFSIKECEIHGLVKFRGDSCGKCAGAKRAATMAKKRLIVEPVQLPSKSDI